MNLKLNTYLQKNTHLPIAPIALKQLHSGLNFNTITDITF